MHRIEFATPQRRQFLHTLLASGSAFAAPSLLAAAAPPQTPGATENAAATADQTSAAVVSLTEGRLIVVFLRGAYDGLSALVPHGDADYYRLRPNIAIPAPDGSAQTTIKLDASFGLHPALAALYPLWQQGVLAVLPCAGSPDTTRSHFDAQHHWEIGIPGKSSAADGWMNTMSALQGAALAQSKPQATAIGVGEANPVILSGAAPVQLVPKGQAATRQGALGDARTREAVMKLYSGQDRLSQAFRAGADSRMQTAQTLSAEQDEHAMDSAQMLAANNGAGNVQGLLLDAQHLGTLMRQNRSLRFGFLSAGGWDTHANQGAVSGSLAGSLGNLAAALLQLRRDFSRPGDVVVVCSEFGRTSAENGTRGTDHGHGNALWLMGGQVQGGRWHGTWSGLAAGNLHEGRDLPVHHDFRAVLAQVLRTNQGLTFTQTQALFPGFTWDKSLDGLMRA
jgi:uncharacterized protein (DUF1501 family)